MKVFVYHITFILALSQNLMAQKIHSGFSKQEYRDLMLISAQMGGADYSKNFVVPQNYKFLYRSPVLGLDNLWDLYMRTDGVAVISIRGTTENDASWLANFHAALVPAKGEVKLSDFDTFTYQLADNPKAAVHIGWLVSTGFLSFDILPKIDSLIAGGINDFLIIGHSQGGAIAYLLTAYLLDLKAKGRLPHAFNFKTYCSAAPKPGNLFFAYEFENRMAFGRAFNVINAEDWVPQVPISIQTLDDFSTMNPFVHAERIIKNQKFPKNVALKRAYKQMNKPTRKAQKNYQKYMGEMAEKAVNKKLNGFQAPDYVNSNHYVRTGQTIVLMPDVNYYEKFAMDGTQFWTHHLHAPYIYLTDKLEVPADQEAKNLISHWKLKELDGQPRLDTLFNMQWPMLKIHEDGQKFSGNSGCNTYMGRMNTSGEGAIFSKAATTLMACPSRGEEHFLKAFVRVDFYVVQKNELWLYAGSDRLLVFERVN